MLPSRELYIWTVYEMRQLFHHVQECNQEIASVKITPWEDAVTSVNLDTTICQQKILRVVKNALVTSLVQ